jgi:hypothetical protein
MVMVQLSSVPDFIKRSQLFQELCSQAASEKKQFVVNGAELFCDLAPQDGCGDGDVDISAIYLLFPAQYCRFDVAAALDAPSPRSVKVAEVMVEPTSEPRTAAASVSHGHPCSCAYDKQSMSICSPEWSPGLPAVCA